MAAGRRDDGRRAAFLAGLERGLSVAGAAAAAGVHRSLAYKWRQMSRDFEAAWRLAEQAGADLLEDEALQWSREILANSPTAIRFLKAALNADCDGQAGLQELAGSATLLFYQSEEGQEGRNAFVEKRKPRFDKFQRFP